MMTERIKPSPEDLALLPLNHPRRLERAMKKEDWIETHASGTLRKNVRIGMAGDTQYREERICYEFGWEFEMVPATRVTFNTAITEGDCSPVTEAGWHIERFLALQPFPEDEFECKYIIIDRGNDLVDLYCEKWVPQLEKRLGRFWSQVQEVYLGYLPEEDQFIIGFDAWGDEEKGHPQNGCPWFRVSAEEDGSVLILDPNMFGEGMFYQGAYESIRERYRGFRNGNPNLVDLRLD